MKIYLDNIIFSLQPTGGISVYWAELLKHLIASDTSVHVLEHPKSLRNVQRQALDLPVDTINDVTTIPVKLSRYLPVQRTCPGADIFHSSYYRTLSQNGIKQVVTVYDFTYEFYFTGLQRFVHCRQKRHAFLNADGIICISESTKNDLLRIYPEVSADRVRVIPLCASGSFYPLVNVPLPKELKWIRSTKYILFIGTRVKYKNFDQAVMAVEMLRGYNLVIIGGGDLRREEQSLLERSLKGRYRHLLGMPEEVLNIIYNHAFCLLYSSSYEGFGFPPLEAMQAGCPVVAVNTSSLPEVCGDAGLLVKNPEAELFYNEIISLEDSHLRHTVVEKGMTQATMFNWDRTFQKTMTFYQEIAGGFSGVGTTS